MGSKKKIYSYPRSITLKDAKGNIIMSIITQLYQIGVYIAVYYGSNPIPNQLTLKPSEATKYMKCFADEKNLKNKTNKIEVGSIIKVKEEEGLFVEA